MTVQKLVLMVQPVRLQGLIWQAVLKSQQIAVIWETPETNLAENLDQLKAAGLVLPDLLILDMQSPTFNPYAFCRWCREQYPKTKVVLTNSGQTDLSLSERQWAVNQGASDLLPGFHQENLVSGVAIAVKRVLEILDEHPLNNGALISVLLTIKRELDVKASAISRVSKQTITPSNVDQNNHLMISTPHPASVAQRELLAAGQALTNGNALKNGTNGKTGKNGAAIANGKSSMNGTALSTGALEVEPSQTDLSQNSSVQPRTTPDPVRHADAHQAATPRAQPALESDKGQADAGHTSQPMRRYRGLYY